MQQCTLRSDSPADIQQQNNAAHSAGAYMQLAVGKHGEAYGQGYGSQRILRMKHHLKQKDKADIDNKPKSIVERFFSKGHTDFAHDITPFLTFSCFFTKFPL